RVLVESHRVPLLDVDDLVLDLDPPGAPDDHVHLFLGDVLVPEGDAESRLETEEGEAQRLAADRGAREPGLHLGRHLELRRRVLDAAQVRLRVTAHRAPSWSSSPTV